MPYIPTEPVESSNIEAIGYDRKTSTLRIIFQGHGGGPSREYDYPMVPEQEFRKLMEAESKGKFFNARIKPMYAHRTPRPEELEVPVPCCTHSKADDYTCTEACFPCDPGCCPSPEESVNVQEGEELVVVPLPFWSPVEGGERPDGSVPSDTTHTHGIEEHDPNHEGEDERHAHSTEEHDHEGGDEYHVHDADGLPVAVPPSALPRTSTGEVDYATIPDASHLFEDQQSVPGYEGEVSVPDESGEWKPIDMVDGCCGAPADAPPGSGCCHGVGSAGR